MIKKEIAYLNQVELEKLSKRELIKKTLYLQALLKSYEALAKKGDFEFSVLAGKLEALKEKERNLKTNQPSSKKPEWDKDGNPINNSAPKKKNRRHKKQPGCGNKSKSTLIPDHTNRIKLDACPDCGNNLKKKIGKENPARIIEDVAPPAKKTIVFKEITESKWCDCCKKMVCSKSEKALPGSDIGLNAIIEIAYLWVMISQSLPNIKSFFQSFKSCIISTAGISKIMVRLSNIMQPVYEEILNDVKAGGIIWADETGWRVKGILWWLWVFANKRSAYYWPDKNRSGAVVEKILGSIFDGLLTADAWGAYNDLISAKQTCMPHIYRKIQAFIIDFPQYRTILTFYLKLRKILRDGEKLQEKRYDLKEDTFQHNLKKLEQRLQELLNWKNPNDILKKIIKKVQRQQDKILTFISHDGAESSNNFAEYIIKKGVIKRKISGGSKSAEGFHAYACIQSIAMTCHLRKISFSDFLRKSLVQYIRTGKPMLLAEYEEYISKSTNIAA